MIVQIPAAFQFLFRPARYKVAYGGRGSGKSANMARALVALAYSSRHRILCLREFMAAIKDSSKAEIETAIEAMGLKPYFHSTLSSIYCRTTGSEFIFKGCRLNAQEIKSTSGVTICYFDEAQQVSKNSLDILIPTIRAPRSELWFAFNPLEETDAIYDYFINKPPSSAVVRKVNYSDNPYFPPELDADRLHCLASDPDAYDWIWEGNCRQISEAVIFKGKYVIEAFVRPANQVLYHGADFGFAVDPSTLLRCWVTGADHDKELWIDTEGYGVGIETRDLGAMYMRAAGETVKHWPVGADCSRPETITELRRQGFNAFGAKKWDGSVEDGIEFLRGFKQIHVHQQCKHTAQEFRTYKFKTDKNNGQILPVPEDRNNHCIDALRYGMDGLIKKNTSASNWAALA